METTSPAAAPSFIRATSSYATPPSVGRIVHYASIASGTISAALITGLNEDGSVSLHVFERTQAFDLGAVQAAETPTPGRWSWPPLQLIQVGIPVEPSTTE